MAVENQMLILGVVEPSLGPVSSIWSGLMSQLQPYGESTSTV